MIDGFVKSQIGSLRCLLSGVSTPAAKFQELVASSSNSLEFFNAAGVQILFPKEAMSLPNPTFYKTVNIVGYGSRKIFIIHSAIFNHVKVTGHA